MRVAVYNRHWTTLGGGERYAGAFAQALAAEHEVDLLGHELDRALLEERLGLDLGAVTPRLVLDRGPGSVTEASRDYDLFVSSSYMSAEPCGAPSGIYVVLFPTPFDADLSTPKRLLARALGPAVARRDATLAFGAGFHLPETARVRRFCWTSAESHLLVTAPVGEALPVRLWVGGRPAEAGPAEVEVTVDGESAARVRVPPGRRSTAVDVAIQGRGPDDPVDVAVHCAPFVPRELLGGDDVRELGVQLRAVRLGRGPTAWAAAAFPVLAAPPPSLAFLDTYDRIVSISEFTREWVRRSFGRDSDVLYPPVPQLEPAEKEPLLLSVGRFFGRTSGHSKKQLELVRAFGRLVRRGLEGWEYHLVGGCSPEHEPYLEEVRRAARGLPVTIHVDASGAELRDLYARASVFWHAAGLGESERRHPHRLEHFGITTAEAMSAGAVPIVVGRAGQREIVEHGTSGFHVESARELVERTLAVARDAALRERVSAAARRRAADFAPERFAAGALEIARGVAARSGVR